MKYIKTKYKGLYINPVNGEFYSDYIINKMTKKKSKLRKGIKTIGYNKEGCKTYINVRREVALLLVPNPNNKRIVITIDGDPMNSSPNNLQWSNVSSMDYKAFGKKKKGMVYKSYVDEVIGDYTVTIDDSINCTMSCNSCKNIIVVPRKKVRGKKKCNCNIDKSLDISSLSSVAFKNWEVLKEDKTETLNNADKKLIVRCKCCKQEESVKYKSYINKNRGEYKCDILKEKRRILLVKYSNMKQRCYSDSNPSYKSYGGRGITICEEWLEDSEKFVMWALYNNFEIGLEIDRKDNDKGYFPKNCRFVTKQVNNQNQSTTLLTEKIVTKIKNTNWNNMNNSDIARSLGFKKDTPKYARAIRLVLKENTWSNII